MKGRWAPITHEAPNQPSYKVWLGADSLIMLMAATVDSWIPRVVKAADGLLNERQRRIQQLGKPEKWLRPGVMESFVRPLFCIRVADLPEDSTADMRELSNEANTNGYFNDVGSYKARGLYVKVEAILTVQRKIYIINVTNKRRSSCSGICIDEEIVFLQFRVGEADLYVPVSSYPTIRISPSKAIARIVRCADSFRKNGKARKQLKQRIKDFELKMYAQQHEDDPESEGQERDEEQEQEASQKRDKSGERRSINSSPQESHSQRMRKRLQRARDQFLWEELPECKTRAQEQQAASKYHQQVMYIQRTDNEREGNRLTRQDVIDHMSTVRRSRLYQKNFRPPRMPSRMQPRIPPRLE